MPAAPLFRGRRFGILVHASINSIPMASYRDAKNFASWWDSPNVNQVMSHLGALHQFASDGVEAAARMVYAAMTTPVSIGDGVHLAEGLGAVAAALGEASLLFPIRKESAAHARTLVTGSVDFIFKHAAKVYFCDWKTDILTPEQLVSRETMQQHFSGSDYRTQASLYTLAVIKALRIGDEATYERLFGGFVYCYVRYLSKETPQAAVYGRLTWSELTAFASDLARREAA
jgi:ATP-dependent exoDNAse (exonuclease V) beta subunit